MHSTAGDGIATPLFILHPVRLLDFTSIISFTFSLPQPTFPFFHFCRISRISYFPTFCFILLTPDCGRHPQSGVRNPGSAIRGHFETLRQRDDLLSLPPDSPQSPSWYQNLVAPTSYLRKQRCVFRVSIVYQTLASSPFVHRHRAMGLVHLRGNPLAWTTIASCSLAMLLFGYDQGVMRWELRHASHDLGLILLVV
jgi:hypothetical protein